MWVYVLFSYTSFINLYDINTMSIIIKMLDYIKCKNIHAVEKNDKTLYIESLQAFFSSIAFIPV